jgi:DNA-binding transcriptional MerR regulator
VSAAGGRSAGGRHNGGAGDGRSAADRHNVGAGTSAVSERPLRIGEVAELAGTTPRTIRYYEEIGLLPGSAERAQGEHRYYTERDVERMREILRLKELLGLSLEQLTRLVAAQDARAELRREYAATEDEAEHKRILAEALEHIETQIDLVRGRRRALEELEQELLAKRTDVRRKLTGLGR